PIIGNSSGRQNHGRENLCSVRLQVGSGLHQGQNRWQDGRSMLRRVRPEAEGSQLFVTGGLSYECESANYEPSLPATAAGAARRSNKDKGSSSWLLSMRSGVWTCVRKGKHNDFETRIECDGGTWKQFVARPAQCADLVRPYQLCRARLWTGCVIRSRSFVEQPFVASPVSGLGGYQAFHRGRLAGARRHRNRAKSGRVGYRQCEDAQGISGRLEYRSGRSRRQ